MICRLYMYVQNDAIQKISSGIYGNFWKHYCEVPQMVLDDPTAIKKYVLWLVGACHLCIVLQKEWSLWSYGSVNWLLSFKGFLNHQSLGFCMWCEPKSYNRGYIHFCVPWIFEVFTNDPCAGTTNDCVCCLHHLSVHVGICSICRLWFSWGLASCEALLLHL